MSESFKIQKLVIFVVIATIILFLLPMFINAFSENSFFESIKDKSKGFSFALLRTIGFALISSVINCTGGLCLAILLMKIPFFSKLGRQLSIFILPITLGNVAISYVFKISLYNTAFFDSIVTTGYVTQTIVLLAIQFWQYGFLFAYLFWISINGTSSRINNYSIAIQHTKYEKLKDIILPNVKNLFILLFFISFIFSFYEDAKNQFIFKASQGMNTELISQVLTRTYKSDLLINGTFANNSMFNTGLFAFITVLLIIVIVGVGIYGLFNFLTKNKFSFKTKNSSNNDKNVGNIIVAIISITIIILPLFVSLLKSQYDFSFDNYIIILPFILTIISALLATLLTVSFGIASRLVFRKWLHNFNSKSMWYFIAIFLLQLIPPICIVICGFQWLSWIGYNSWIYAVWIVGHCILVFPILGSFIVATHFTVDKNEIDYFLVHKISLKSIIKYNFLKRYKAEYFLTFLFAFIFIWNDTSLNMILSDQIPSFAKQLQMLFIGRGADYPTATIFVLISIAISGSCVLLWQSIIRKTAKSNNL